MCLRSFLTPRPWQFCGSLACPVVKEFVAELQVGGSNHAPFDLKRSKKWQFLLSRHTPALVTEAKRTVLTCQGFLCVCSLFKTTVQAPTYTPHLRDVQRFILKLGQAVLDESSSAAESKAIVLNFAAPPSRLALTATTAALQTSWKRELKQIIGNLQVSPIPGKLLTY